MVHNRPGSAHIVTTNAAGGADIVTTNAAGGAEHRAVRIVAEWPYIQRVPASVIAAQTGKTSLEGEFRHIRRDNNLDVGSGAHGAAGSRTVP
jgi:hypothetical protein